MTQLTEVEVGEVTARRAANLDLLRLVALIGVIIYQWFGWAWTPIVIPFAALTLTVLTEVVQHATGNGLLVFAEGGVQRL